MIKIYTKTDEELEKENSLYRFGAALVKSYPKKACPTYIVRQNGEKVDTDRLTEAEIIDLIDWDLYDYTSQTGTYISQPRTGLDTFEFLNVVRDKWTPSCEAILKLELLSDKYGFGIMSDIIGSADKNSLHSRAWIIARYQKQCNDDFSDVTRDEIRAVLKQMAINEKKQKQMKKRTF